MRKIINLTQHAATPEQIAQGVIEPTPAEKAEISRLLTVENLPTLAERRERCCDLADLATIIGHREGADSAMIGGVQWLMDDLELALHHANITPFYACNL